MLDTETLKNLIAPIVAAVGGLGWLFRLEGKAKKALEETVRLEKQMDRDRTDAQVSRRETNEILREMQRDIKRLLERGPHG